ncbi:uncharacterized protein BP5553_02072 [Venustampulla echinocandica]|uniref:Peptidase S54 rhomboid domain-containing protein n=1 Tax=Venustampulla echinocandica TaxID=2656787 RepID=A0A370U2Z1_9HELO|nr:uncharacterized protein BP5553_02072 [Venustampulla echinocandica]RDL42093.1 hypothetical protein BP5553_02072 [Venustampulla echinocandica]
MNSLWPSLPRVSCLDTRTILRTCCKVDSLAARLAQRNAQSYSSSSAPYLRKTTRCQESGGLKRIPGGAILGFALRTGARTYASKPLVTRYQKLPKGYTPNLGLPFRSKPLSANEVKDIFGAGIDAHTANRLMMMMHGQRVAGTLEDPNGQTIFTPYEDRARQIALAWLRENVPVDEVGNAGLKAEQELREMEAEIVADSRRIGLYKPNSSENAESPYGKSVLDEVRAAKEKAWEEKKKSQEATSQADEIRQNTGPLATVGPKARAELRKVKENQKFEEYMKKAKALKAPPEMTKFQRLWPSALVVLGTILASYVFTQVYTPPKQSVRLFPDIPPAAATVMGIILANTVIFAAWRLPVFYRFLNMNFITVPGYPYAFSILGNIFSHQALGHFAMNMAFIWVIGTRLHEEIGRANFLAVYFSTGVVGSFASLSHFVLRGSFVSSSLGASGAICGIVATYLWLNGSEKMQLFGVFPPTDWPSFTGKALLATLIGLELIGLWRGNGVRVVDHFAHLGGYGAGIAAAAFLNASRRRREAAERERNRKLGYMQRIKEGKSLW